MKAHLALLGVDEPGTDVLHANLLDKVPDFVVVHTCPQGSKEVDGLAGEGVHNLLHLTTSHTVLLEDTHGDTNAVLTSGSPVELLHTPVTNQWGVQGAEVITCHVQRWAS